MWAKFLTSLRAAHKVAIEVNDARERAFRAHAELKDLRFSNGIEEILPREISTDDSIAWLLSSYVEGTADGGPSETVERDLAAALRDENK